MKLQEAIKSIIELKSTSILNNVLVLNILSDYNAFEEISSSKNVLKNVISEGYMEKILFAHDNQLDLQGSSQTYINELYEKYGFRKDSSVYVINSILLGLGYNHIADYKTEEEPIKEHKQDTTIVPQTKTGDHLLFRDIEINGTISSVCSELERLGYSAPIFLEGGSAVVKGDFAGVPNCEILIIKSRYADFVWKIVVLMPENNNWYSLKGEYERFKKMFTLKYGKPKSYEFFSDPYEEGDGYEHTALSVGKCTYVSYYNMALGVISLNISENGAINIGYEDKANCDKNSNAVDNIASLEI